MAESWAGQLAARWVEMMVAGSAEHWADCLVEMKVVQRVGSLAALSVSRWVGRWVGP
jgi:hypothetical protein